MTKTISAGWRPPNIVRDMARAAVAACEKGAALRGGRLRNAGGLTGRIDARLGANLYHWGHSSSWCLTLMSYNYSVLFAKIVEAVTETGSFTTRMHQLIKFCEQQVPHEDWNSMRQIDYEADRQTLGRWLVRSFAEADPSILFKGLWFGIHNLAVRGQSTADIYVSASTKFEPKSLDWAVAAEFFPDARYLNSIVLASIYRLAYTRPTSLGNDAEYPLSLAYGAMVSCAALHSARLTGPFAHLVGAAAGFDDGDLMLLGSFSEGRFSAMPAAG